MHVGFLAEEEDEEREVNAGTGWFSDDIIIIINNVAPCCCPPGAGPGVSGLYWHSLNEWPASSPPAGKKEREQERKEKRKIEKEEGNKVIKKERTHTFSISLFSRCLWFGNQPTDC